MSQSKKEATSSKKSSKSKAKQTKETKVTKSSPKKTFDSSLVESKPLKSTTDSQQVSSKTKYYAAGMIVLGIVIALGMYARKQLIVATVNGQPIYRTQIIAELEKQYGEAALENKITEILIMQEAQNQGLTVTPEEVDTELATIEQTITAQGQDLDQLLELDGMNRDELRSRIKLQKTVEKLAPQGQLPTEEEIQNTLEQQADFFPEEMSEEEKKVAISQQLQQQAAGQSTTDYLDLIKSQAQIQYHKEY